MDGYLYGEAGKCIVADSGNSYAVHLLPGHVQVLKNDVETGFIPAGERVIVSRTGKVKTSGTVVIDGIKYTISNRSLSARATTVTGYEYESIPWVVTDEKYVD